MTNGFYHSCQLSTGICGIADISVPAQLMIAARYCCGPHQASVHGIPRQKGPGQTWKIGGSDARRLSCRDKPARRCAPILAPAPYAKHMQCRRQAYAIRFFGCRVQRSSPVLPSTLAGTSKSCRRNSTGTEAKSASRLHNSCTINKVCKSQCCTVYTVHTEVRYAGTKAGKAD